MIPVYICPTAFKPWFSLAGKAESFIGIPNSRKQLTALGADWRFVTAPTKVDTDLWVNGATTARLHHDGPAGRPAGERYKTAFAGSVIEF